MNDDPSNELKPSLRIFADTAGLVVASIEQLEEFNSEWREWFQDLEPDERYFDGRTNRQFIPEAFVHD